MDSVLFKMSSKQQSARKIMRLHLTKLVKREIHKKKHFSHFSHFWPKIFNIKNYGIISEIIIGPDKFKG